MSIDTSLSDLIFRSAEHPGALPDFIICAGCSPLGLTLLRPQPSPVDGQSESSWPLLTHLLQRQQALTFCLIFPSSMLEVLKQNPIYKDMVDLNNTKAYLFNTAVSSNWHLIQSISACRTERQVRDKLTVVIKKDYTWMKWCTIILALRKLTS